MSPASPSHPHLGLFALLHQVFFTRIYPWLNRVLSSHHSISIPIQDPLYLLHSECVLPKSDRGVLDNTLLFTPLDSDPPNPHPDSIYPHISLYLTTKTNMVLSPAFFYVCFIGLSLIPRFRRSVVSDTHQSVIHSLVQLIFRGRRIIHSFHLISLFYFQSPI